MDIHPQKFYLYHRVPYNLEGSILYPLNELKTKMPDIYKEHIQKYEGRREIMNLILPPFGCKWNDVLHLSTIHPDKFIEPYDNFFGFTQKTSVFEIDPITLDQEQLMIFKNINPDLVGVDKLLPDPNQWERFSEKALAEYQEIPEWTLRYYKAMKNREGLKLMHAGCAHVFYWGAIDISGIKII